LKKFATKFVSAKTETVIMWNTFCYTAGSIKPDLNNMGARATAKKDAESVYGTRWICWINCVDL